MTSPPPELEDEDLLSNPPLGALEDEASEVELVDDDPLDALEPLDDDDVPVDESDPEDFFADEYRSAYQPPPFKMNVELELICRLAVSSPHLGQVVNGGSTIRCSASHACAQAGEEHAYS